MSDTKTAVKDRKLAAETAKLEAEARKLTAQAVEAEASSRVALATAEMELRDIRYTQAADEFNHVYKFNGAVKESSVQLCQSVLSKWSRLDPDCSITVIFNSPGGSVIDGMALWDFLQNLRDNGHHLTTVCRGMAASMAGILLQAGDKRVIGRESYVLIHEISTVVYGKIGEIEDEVAFMKKIGERVIDIFVSRSNLTAAQIRKNWKKTDWWLSSRDCLEHGLVDEVR